MTSNTIFAHDKLSFRTMLVVMALWVHSVKGKAALQVCREAGIGYKSAWVMLMKLREALAAAEPDVPLDGIVEIDGTHVNNYNRPDNRRMDRPDFRLVENAAPGDAQTVTALRQRRQDVLGIPDRVWATVTLAINSSMPKTSCGRRWPERQSFCRTSTEPTRTSVTSIGSPTAFGTRMPWLSARA